MENIEKREDFKRLVYELFKSNPEARKCICNVIDRLDEIKGKENTEPILVEQCKEAYNYMRGIKNAPARDNELIYELVHLLKIENKLPSFTNTAY